MRSKEQTFLSHLPVLFQEMNSKGVIFALTHLLTQCKSQYITGIKLGRSATMFSQKKIPCGGWPEKVREFAKTYP